MRKVKTILGDCSVKTEVVEQLTLRYALQEFTGVCCAWQGGKQITGPGPVAYRIKVLWSYPKAVWTWLRYATLGRFTCWLWGFHTNLEWYADATPPGGFCNCCATELEKVE